ncbi:LVIVD repeat-containing protein [halophilic archaeon DL31]|jgi:PGF-CTERM protein|nr:LVIVD repeat-containing protein [halophilic archaeon DL31]
MRRRETLRFLGGSLAATSLSGVVGAHPTPSGTDDDATPAPTRTDAGYGPLGNVEVAGATEAVTSDDGTLAFIAATDGYAIVDISTPSQPTVLAERRALLADREDGPLSQIHDVKQNGNTLLVVGPANGPSGESLSGALLVDVSDPESPTHRGFYETDYPIHNGDLVDGRAYLTANGSEDVRLEIIDVTAEPTRLGSWALTDHEPGWEALPRLLRVVHDVWVQNGTAYLAHWDAGVWILDVRDPASPTVLGHIGDRSPEQVVADADGRSQSEQISLPGNAHVAVVDDSSDLLALGREAWATPGAPPGTTTAEPDGGPGGIDLYDVSDPAAPVLLSTIEPPATVDATLSGSWTTAHNCELRDDVLYSSWYRGGVKRHDVSDPANPVELTWWADPPHAEFWTARVGVPGETFVASSRGTETSSPGLYVFPDEPGTTTWGFEDRVGETPTVTERQPTTPTETPTPVPTTEPEPTTATESPGFGVLAALAALGTGTLVWRRDDGE